MICEEQRIQMKIGNSSRESNHNSHGLLLKKTKTISSIGEEIMAAPNLVNLVFAGNLSNIAIVTIATNQVIGFETVRV